MVAAIDLTMWRSG